MNRHTAHDASAPSTIGPATDSGDTTASVLGSAVPCTSSDTHTIMRSTAAAVTPAAAPTIAPPSNSRVARCSRICAST